MLYTSPGLLRAGEDGATVSSVQGQQHDEAQGGRGRGSVPDPSSSLLLKQLSIIRRFSSSNRSARLMPPDDDMALSAVPHRRSRATKDIVCQGGQTGGARVEAGGRSKGEG